LPGFSKKTKIVDRNVFHTKTLLYFVYVFAGSLTLTLAVWCWGIREMALSHL